MRPERNLHKVTIGIRIYFQNIFLPGWWGQNYGVVEFHDDEIKDRFPVSFLKIIRDFSKSVRPESRSHPIFLTKYPIILFIFGNLIS